MLGAGVTYSINQTTMLFITGAYDLGLTNLNSKYGEKSGSSQNTEKDVTKDIRVNVGILIGLGGD